MDTYSGRGSSEEWDVDALMLFWRLTELYPISHFTMWLYSLALPTHFLSGLPLAELSWLLSVLACADGGPTRPSWHLGGSSRSLFLRLVHLSEVVDIWADPSMVCSSPSGKGNGRITFSGHLFVTLLHLHHFLQVQRKLGSNLILSLFYIYIYTSMCLFYGIILRLLWNKYSMASCHELSIGRHFVFPGRNCCYNQTWKFHI